MAEILDMNNVAPTERDQKITKEQVTELASTLEELIPDQTNVADDLMKLLALPEEKFVLVSRGVLQSYQQTLNNPGNKLALTQAVNAAGYRAEDLIKAFTDVGQAIDDTDLSINKRDFLKGIIGTLCNAVNETEGISKRTLVVPIQRCHDDAIIPQYAHITDSGMDVYAIEDITIHPGETALIPTGLRVAIPVGYELQVRPKSGRALKTKLRIANTPGTIDQGYHDEIKIIIENVDPPIKELTFDDEGHVTSILYGSDFFITKGEKFAQLVLAEVPRVAFTVVDSLDAYMDNDRTNENGESGFGSTGLT